MTCVCDLWFIVFYLLHFIGLHIEKKIHGVNSLKFD
jgi:hypothetical protein